MRFKGVVNLPLLPLCKVSVAWELADRRSNWIRSLVFLPSLPTALGWNGLWSTWALHLYLILVLFLLTVLVITDLPKHSPNWYLLDNVFSWVLYWNFVEGNAMLMWKWFQDDGCLLPLCILWFFQPQKIPNIRAQDFCFLSVPNWRQKNLKISFSTSVVPRFCCTLKYGGGNFKNPDAQVSPS